MKLDFDFINRKIMNWSIEPKIDDLRFFHVCRQSHSDQTIWEVQKKILDSETQ